MDINGARALRARLEKTARGPLPETAGYGETVAESAPRVYHWFGIAKHASADETPVPAKAPQLTWRRRVVAIATRR